MLLGKNIINNNNKKVSGNRILISVTVIGSAGPIRFIVDESRLVAAVIDTALKTYAREGRLPVLGSDPTKFVLYCPVSQIEALNPWDTIGSIGVRNFMLCKKPEVEKVINGDKPVVIASKGSGKWKSWLNKSLNLKIYSH